MKSSHNSTRTDISSWYVPTEGNRGDDVNNNAMVRSKLGDSTDLMMFEKTILLAFYVNV